MVREVYDRSTGRMDFMGWMGWLFSAGVKAGAKTMMH